MKSAASAKALVMFLPQLRLFLGTLRKLYKQADLTEQDTSKIEEQQQKKAQKV